MKMIILNKQKHNEPEFDELYMMLSDLKDFLNEDANPNDKQWNKNLDTILEFQDSDGSFKLFNSYKIPSDAVIDFCFMPTYICTAILMKAYITNPSAFTSKEKCGLLNGLEMSCTRNLVGHGFEGFHEQIEALNIFIKAGLNEFMDLHPDFCPKFSKMIKEITSQYKDMESEGKFFGPWGESYEKEIKAINEYFSQRKVFVYGTLMRGEGNHYHLKNSICLGKAFIEGYDMYDVGYYPAIIPGDSLIIGELYQVPKEDMQSIDMLEGEGSLYAKKCETVTDAEGNTFFAFVYIYLNDCSDLKRISAWNNDYVWYVSYGSNMLRERFLCYIKGGAYESSRYRLPCKDPTPPLAIKTLEIPYEMYYGNKSQSWENCGVSFLNTSRKGIALGVAYLITKEQFHHVRKQENGGREPEKGNIWYEDTIDLGMMDGFEVKTITNNIPRIPNTPCSKYREILHRGIKENWPEMSDDEIDDYIYECMRNKRD
jgi:gamma-glutamylcyclotransferase (GGCT)/AIG2-like uncharacterized protein YtfP